MTAKQGRADLKLVLLPGLDGTGLLFKPFIDALPSGVETSVIAYPVDEKLSYEQLTEYVIERLPKTETFVLLAESFSGPVACKIALQPPANMKSVVFIASFLAPPQKLVLGLSRLLPRRLLLSLPVPEFVVKLFLLGPDVSASLIDLFRMSLSKVSAKVLSYRLDEIAGLKFKAQRCDLEAVYIQASDDYLVPEQCVEPFREVMHKLKVYQVKGPHFILQANPQNCADILLEEVL